MWSWEHSKPRGKEYATTRSVDGPSEWGIRLRLDRKVSRTSSHPQTSYKKLSVHRRNPEVRLPILYHVIYQKWFLTTPIPLRQKPDGHSTPLIGVRDSSLWLETLRSSLWQLPTLLSFLGPTEVTQGLSTVEEFQLLNFSRSWRPERGHTSDDTQNLRHFIDHSTDFFMSERRQERGKVKNNSRE